MTDRSIGDINDISWTRGPNLPRPIKGQAQFGADAYSGDRPGPYINAVEALDLAHPEDGWRDVAPLPGMGRDNAADRNMIISEQD